MTLRHLSLLLALIWMALIFYLSNQPTLDTPALFKYQDKVMHAGAYGLLAALILGSFPVRFPPGYSKLQAWISALLASLYGLSDEIHQYFVPGRSAEVTDWLADTLGAMAAAHLFAQLSRSLSKSQSKRQST